MSRTVPVHGYLDTGKTFRLDAGDVLAVSLAGDANAWAFSSFGRSLRSWPPEEHVGYTIFPFVAASVDTDMLVARRTGPPVILYGIAGCKACKLAEEYI